MTRSREYTITSYDTRTWHVRKIATTGFGVEALYTVQLHRVPRRRFTCNCPARVERCRHIEMVEQFILAGEPVPFLIER